VIEQIVILQSILFQFMLIVYYCSVISELTGGHCNVSPLAIHEYQEQYLDSCCRKVMWIMVRKNQTYLQNNNNNECSILKPNYKTTRYFLTEWPVGRKIQEKCCQGLSLFP